MKKTILLYGFLLAVLTGLLKFFEYRYLVRELSIEFYIGTIALFFTGLGVWLGLKLTRQKTLPQNGHRKPFSAGPNPVHLESVLEKYGISKREHEVLTLIAKGLSNKEIAKALFLSTNTIKTHSSNLFAKLDVKRRTQAVQRATEIGLLDEDMISD